MKHSKLLKTGFALTLTVVSLHANAIPAKAGLEACAKAMVNDIAASQGSPVAYDVSPYIMSGNIKLGRREVFHLDAMNKDGGKVVARVDCFVNQKAQVTRMIRVPLDGKDARSRATTFN